jgi:transposase
MPRLRFVKNVSDEAKEQLSKVYHNAPDFAFRKRAHAVLLSAMGHTINQLQAIFEVDRDTVAAWFDRFEAGGVEGLKSLPKPGRPPIYTEDEVGRLKELVDLEPRQIKQAQAALQQATGKSSCTATLKRALKKTAIPGTAAGAR